MLTLTMRDGSQVWQGYMVPNGSSHRYQQATITALGRGGEGHIHYTHLFYVRIDLRPHQPTQRRLAARSNATSRPDFTRSHYNHSQQSLKEYGSQQRLAAKLAIWLLWSIWGGEILAGNRYDNTITKDVCCL